MKKAIHSFSVFFIIILNDDAKQRATCPQMMMMMMMTRVLPSFFFSFSIFTRFLILLYSFIFFEFTIDDTRRYSLYVCNGTGVCVCWSIIVHTFQYMYQIYKHKLSFNIYIQKKMNQRKQNIKMNFKNIFLHLEKHHILN